MRSRLLLNSLIISVVLICAFGLLFPFFIEKVETPPLSAVKGALKQAYFSSRILDKEGGIELQFVSGSKERWNVGREWRNTIKSNMWIFKEPGHKAFEELVRDPFGNFFYIGLRTELEKMDFNKDMLEIPSAIIIWSGGPNGINDFGFNDDIFLLKADYPWGDEKIPD